MIDYITQQYIIRRKDQIVSLNTARKDDRGSGWSRGSNPEVVTSALVQTKQKPEPSVGPLTKPKA